MTIGIVVVMVALVPVVYFVAGRIMAEPEKSTVAPPASPPRNCEPFTLEQPALAPAPELVPQIDLAALQKLRHARFARGSMPPANAGCDLDEAETLRNVAPVR